MTIVPLAAFGTCAGVAAGLVARAALPTRWTSHPAWQRATVVACGVAGALLLGRTTEAMIGAPAGALAPTSALLLAAMPISVVVCLVLARLGVLAPDAPAIPVAAALLVTALGFVPLASSLAPSREGPWFALIVLYWIVAGGLLLLVLAGLARWLPSSLDRVERAIAGQVMGVSSRRFVWSTAAFAFAACALFAAVCFSRRPHNADEIAQLWHAKILLSGRLSLPADVHPEFFAVDNIIDQGRWYSQFPIGGPAFLALGLAARAAWLVGPILIALTVVSIYSFARRAYDESTARLATALFALSPFALFMGASYMNHVPMLWLASVALAQTAAWSGAERQRDLNRTAAVIGLALGVAFTVRPLDALVVGLVIGVFQLSELRRGGSRARSLGYELAAGLVPLCIVLYVNNRTSGAPLRFGYQALYGDAHELGFHIDPYGVAHTPARALTFASKYMLQLNVRLFEWPLPPLGLIAAGLLVLRRPTRWDYLLLALLGGQLLAYALYWHEGNFRGPRFLFTALPTVIILVARAVFVLAEALPAAGRRVVPLAVAACVLVTWLGMRSNVSIAGRVRAFRGAETVTLADPDSLIRQAGLRHAVVFVRDYLPANFASRLWALGIPRGEAASLLTLGHPCALRQAIELEERAPVPSGDRLARMRNRVRSFDAGGVLPPACLAELAHDDVGAVTYAPFLTANTIDADGAIAGDVVFVRDLGSHDEVLRARFGDRDWYRLDMIPSGTGAAMSLMPYGAPAP